MAKYGELQLHCQLCGLVNRFFCIPGFQCIPNAIDLAPKIGQQLMEFPVWPGPKCKYDPVISGQLLYRTVLLIIDFILFYLQDPAAKNKASA